MLYLLAALAAYWGLLIYQLGAQWSAYEQYNYGWAVPFLCAYLLWLRLKNPELRTQNSESVPGSAPSPGVVFDNSPKTSGIAAASPVVPGPLPAKPPSSTPSPPRSGRGQGEVSNLNES